ncbi:zinc finger transcription factor YY1-like [Aristolochia californica]|uniref:zinc finger transcription factor YY1-like n=1 Tax=Aristolochia californica TaxID=171875 RepID=UPI0035DEB476
MDYPTNPLLFEKRPILNSKAPAVKWFKEWVPQEVAATGGKCYLLKWVTEDMLKALKDKYKDPEPEEQEPEPTTEVLFLCSYEGCGKTFIDAGALRKHSHIHGERQYICTYEGCGKKFLDSSKLKRHHLIHTGERSFICPHEGCGKAFSLDFNLRAHMKTHSQENYHICPYDDCRKRYAHEYKLKSHIKAHHQKHIMTETMKHTPPSEKQHSAQKTPAVYATPTSDRPYACPYEGCGKSYIHEYKLNLHLRREHPGHNAEENGKPTPTPDTDHDMDEASDQDAYVGGKGSRSGRSTKRAKPKALSKMIPPSKIARRKSSNLAPANLNVTKKSWPSKEVYEEDSEETEEDRENVEEDRWRYGDNNDDDEETEYED